MAIVISIIGLISGFFITKIKIANKIMKAKVTKENIEIVTASLAAYLTCSNRLPRPANGGDGLESTAGGLINNYVGNVPFKTIGIPEKQAKDGNGRPLVYAVEPDLTMPFSHLYFGNYLETSDYFCAYIRDPKIHVDTIDAQDVIAFVIDTADNFPFIADNAIHVKISANTCWICRNFLLIKYLKNSPCNCETPEKILTPDINVSQENDFGDYGGE
jgi:hypothetical protein